MVGKLVIMNWISYETIFGKYISDFPEINVENFETPLW
jgi:hypothetical protein